MAYELRTKTRKAFKEWELVEIMNFADKVCEFSPEKAREIIWRLTYETRVILCQYTFLDCQMLPEKAMLIRGELINRYRQEKQDLGYQEYAQPKESDSEAIKQLRKQAGGDSVIMYEILKRTSRCNLDHYLADRYDYLMKSNYPAYRLRAFKELGFNERESSFLYNYAEVIADLLKERMESQG